MTKLMVQQTIIKFWAPAKKDAAGSWWKGGKSKPEYFWSSLGTSRGRIPKTANETTVDQKKRKNCKRIDIGTSKSRMSRIVIEEKVYPNTSRNTKLRINWSSTVKLAERSEKHLRY